MHTRVVGAVAALVTMLVTAASTQAATLQPGTFQTSFGPTETLDYTASPGEQNVLHLDSTVELLPVLDLLLFSRMVFADPGARIQSSKCLVQGSKATCLPAASHVRVTLGDGSDRFRQSSTRATLLGLTTDGCRWGCPGLLRVTGGPGDDVIDVRNGKRGISEVTCGPGQDTVYDDGPGDSDDSSGDYVYSLDCETVITG